MNLKEDNFYKTLKDSLEQLPEAEPTAADWESFKLAQGIENSQKKRPFWLYFLLVSTISVLASGSFLLVRTNNNSLAEPKEINNSVKQNLNVSTNQKTAEKQPINSLNTANSIQKNTYKAEVSGSIKKEIKRSYLNNKLAIKNERETAQPEAKDASPENWVALAMSANNNKQSEFEIIEINARKRKHINPDIALQAPPIDGLLTNKKLKRPLQADWISAAIIPIISHPESNTINGGIGIKIGKDFGKGWHYSLGIELSQINKNKTQFWLRDFERNELVKIDTTLKMNANFTKIIMVMDSVYEKRTHTENVVKQHNITSRNIDLPIELGYQIQVRKLSIGGSLGVFNRITHTQISFTEVYPLSKEDTRSFNEKYSYQLLGSMGIILGYPVTNRLWVQATPNLLINTSDRNKTETRLRMGITYYLN